MPSEVLSPGMAVCEHVHGIWQRGHDARVIDVVFMVSRHRPYSEGRFERPEPGQIGTPVLRPSVREIPIEQDDISPGFFYAAQRFLKPAGRCGASKMQIRNHGHPDPVQSITPCGKIHGNLLH